MNSISYIADILSAFDFQVRYGAEQYICFTSPDFAFELLLYNRESRAAIVETLLFKKIPPERLRDYLDVYRFSPMQREVTLEGSEPDWRLPEKPSTLGTVVKVYMDVRISDKKDSWFSLFRKGDRVFMLLDESEKFFCDFVNLDAGWGLELGNSGGFRLREKQGAERLLLSYNPDLFKENRKDHFAVTKLLVDAVTLTKIIDRSGVGLSQVFVCPGKHPYDLIYILYINAILSKFHNKRFFYDFCPAPNLAYGELTLYVYPGGRRGDPIRDFLVRLEKAVKKSGDGYLPYFERFGLPHKGLFRVYAIRAKITYVLVEAFIEQLKDFQEVIVFIY